MDMILNGSLFLTLIAILYNLSNVTIGISADYALLVLFLCYCLGFHIRSICRAVRIRWLQIIAAPNHHHHHHHTVAAAAAARPQSYDEDVGEKISSRSNHDPNSDNRNNHNNYNNKGWIEPLHEIIMGGKGSKEDDDVANSWSRPPYDFYKIRGPNYFHDRIKVRSGPFMFPMRGVDLFLTTEAPKNVGR